MQLTVSKPCASILNDEGEMPRTLYKDDERSHGVGDWFSYLYVYPGCLIKVYAETHYRGTSDSWSNDDVNDWIGYWSKDYNMIHHKWIGKWWENDVKSFRCTCSEIR